VYELLEINKPEDYQKLTRYMDVVYAPAEVGEELAANLSRRCRRILIESDYVDKDYRSTYYNFFAKKGFRYSSLCVRLHFFDERAILHDGHNLVSRDHSEALEKGYFGFMVLRPTRTHTIGRTILSTDAREGFHGYVIKGPHKAHVLGKKFTIQGFPYMSQHSDVSVCAHVACWSILRHYSERFSAYPELLTHDITCLAHQFDPGGIVPSKGIDISNVERIFLNARTYPLTVPRGEEPKLFRRQLFAYIESAFPAFVELQKQEHAIAVIGHGEWILKPPKNEPIYFASDLVSDLIVIDDSQLPYLPVKQAATENLDYGVDDMDTFIVPLPEKIYYPAEAVDDFALQIATQPYLDFDHSSLAPVVVRYFVTTSAAYRQFMDERRSQFDPELVKVAMHLTFPQFLWVMEFSTLTQWANRQIETRIVLDATASSNETKPLFIMHNARRAYVFDRGGDHKEGILSLNAPGNAPFSRMPGNLEKP
jgi:hypothetical protein